MAACLAAGSHHRIGASGLMALKHKAKDKKLFTLPGISVVLQWRLILAGFIALSLFLLFAIWESGVKETVDAFSGSRRLIVRIDTGTIQGRQVSMEHPAAAPVAVVPVPIPEPVPAPIAEASGATDPATAPVPAIVTDMPPATLADAPPITASATPPADVNPMLTEKTGAGTLPAIGKDGVKPWRYYAKPYERKGTLPMIAIVVSGLGQNKTVTDSALRLPEAIALSFTPYARDVGSWGKAARLAGHEVMIDLPLEPSNYPVSDPGPYGLLVGKPATETQAHLQWVMSRFQGYTGFLTPQNESFSSDSDGFKLLMQSMAARGLMLVVGREPPKSDIKQMIESGSTATVVADVLLDEDLSATAIQTRLSSLEQIARNRGYAVGVAQAYPITMEQLNLWAAKLAEAGFVLVPVTFVTKLRFS